MTNIELLDQAMSRIEANPDQHNQAEWICDTGYCLAGFVAVEAGAEPPPLYAQSWWVNPDTGEYLRCGVLDGAVHVAEYARDKLGLHDYITELLFFATNTRNDLRVMVDYLKQHPSATYADMRNVCPLIDDTVLIDDYR